MILIVLGSCASTSDLPEGDKILRRVAYRIETYDKEVNVKKIRRELENIVKQIPQRKSALNPRTWGKPRTVYDKNLAEESAEEFQQYLQNRKGFYKANVTYDEKDKEGRISIVYQIDLGPRNYITSIATSSQDSSLVQLFDNNGVSNLQIDNPLDAKSFETERVRLVEIAKNNGYADFNANFIEFRGDSIGTDTDVKVHIYPPYPKEKHTSYTIGDINIYTEHLSSEDPDYRKVDTLDNRTYFSKSQEFIVDPRTISRILPIKPGDIFSRDAEEKTNRNLTALTPYKFITLKKYKSSSDEDIYNYNLFLTPQDNKWIFNTGGDIFFSLLNENVITNEDLIGLSGNLSFVNRNYKRQAIRHEFGMEASFELEVPSFRANTVSLQFKNSFDIPGIVDIMNTAKFLNWVGLLTDGSYNSLNLNGSTKLDLNMGITSILGFYDLRTVNTSWAYTFQPDIYSRYTYKQIGINIQDTNIKPGFQNILNDNPLLAESFNPYLMTGFLFKELNMSRRTRDNAKGGYWNYLGTFEVSGFENFLLNKTVNLLSSYDDRWSISTLDFAQFVKFDNEVRFYTPVLKRSSFAARFATGIVVPYGAPSSDGQNVVVPYVKQFFVGGPNSLRGWQIRELGPGTYVHNPRTENEPFFQAGGFKLEMNAEYRFDLFYIFEGAVFFDMGNIWTLRAEDERPGALISGNLLDQLAMSTGWGLRLDFDYFLFRFDFGYKLRLPAPDPETGNRWVLTDRNQNASLLGNINFAINYPF